MLALVTVTFNGASVLEQFLHCVLAQIETDWCLIVVDNVSSDQTRDILRNFHDPRLKLIFNETNVGFAAGTNQGISKALALGAETILLINNDTEFGPTLFREMLKTLDKSGADAVTPVIPYFNQPDRIWYGGGRFISWRGAISFHDHLNQPVSILGSAPFEVAFAPACCLLLQRRVFDRVGMMDEDYFVYGEDADFCWRMKEARLKIICDPGLRMMHKVSVSTGGSESDFSIYHIYRSHMIFVRKFRSHFMLIYVLGVLAVKAALRLLLRRTDVRRLKLQAKAMYAGLKQPLGYKPIN
jgi:GT2 family glycosyltransferase